MPSVYLTQSWNVSLRYAAAVVYLNILYSLAFTANNSVTDQAAPGVPENTVWQKYLYISLILT